MFKVYGTDSARDAYKAIKMFDEFKSEGFKSEGAVKDLIDEIKREVRRWANKPSNYFDGNVERRLVKEYGIDGFVELVMLPKDIDSEERANSYFREYIYIEPVNSPFDCTGRAFTGWYKLFNRNGRFYAYHSVDMDV